MKTITLILPVLVSLSLYSQKPYKLYSKVWSMNNELELLPIDKSEFYNYQKIDSVGKKINMELINSYLLKSYNEFRNDYGSTKVVEDVVLSQKSREYSKKLQVNFKHDSFDGTFNFECCGRLSLVYLTKIKPTDGNLNKLVSECVFDIFVRSNPHMKSLLDNGITNIGVGLHINGDTIYVVVRGY